MNFVLLVSNVLNLATLVIKNTMLPELMYDTPWLI